MKDANYANKLFSMIKGDVYMYWQCLWIDSKAYIISIMFPYYYVYDYCLSQLTFLSFKVMIALLLIQLV